MEHSTWLSFMRERLLLIRDLLAPDGSVWVHLDDAEQHRMRCLLDEVLGAQNAIATVVWQSSDIPKSTARHMSVDQDYVSVFAKDASTWRPFKLPREPAMDAKYRNPDADPRGPWLPGPITATKPYSRGTYPIEAPDGKEHWPTPGTYWRFSRERFDELDLDGRIYWGKDGNSRPLIKRYLSEVGDLVPRTLWHYADVGSTRHAKNEMKRLFAIPFATPKPERLMERVLRVASAPGDIVLDCFAGSGTTAGVAHKMGRRWVTAELSPSTVEQFTLPRLTKVVAGDDLGGISKSVGWQGGGGFRTVTVGPSMYEDTAVGVLLAEWATNGRFARAVAGQLGFEFQPDAAPLCGVRGRMRLAVIDGTVGPEEVRQIVGALGEKERVTIVAKSVLPQAEMTLSEVSVGSRIRKAPRDLLTSGARRMRRRTEAPPRHTPEETEGSGS